MSAKTPGIRRGKYGTEACDSPEEIAMCLMCKHPECINCLSRDKGEKNGAAGR